MKILSYLLLLLLVFAGCTTFNNSNLIQSPDIKRNGDCQMIIDDNLPKLLKADTFYLEGQFINKDVKVNTLIDCCLEEEYIKRKDVKKALIKYCNLYIKWADKVNFDPTNYSNSGLISKIILKIDSKERFELQLKIFTYNEPYDWGHGPDRCESTGVVYFVSQIMPGIKSINGQNVREWYKEFELENYFYNYKDDCELSYYNLLYAYIKNAWEEGKIELKEGDIK